MTQIQYVSVGNEDWKWRVESPEVPFPGDEVVLGQWGLMRVIRRSFIYQDSLSDTPGSGMFVGAIVWVREEQAS